MKYSAELIRGVKELYPEDSRMQELADTGNMWLGRYLDDGAMGMIAIDTVLLATSLEELQKKARLQKKKKDLYSKWYKEAYPQNQ